MGNIHYLPAANYRYREAAIASEVELARHYLNCAHDCHARNGDAWSQGYLRYAQDRYEMTLYLYGEVYRRLQPIPFTGGGQ